MATHCPPANGQPLTLDSAINGHDAPAQAAALSRVLGELADRIAATVVAH
ncbi:hypothetical protein [Paraburkholderia sp. HD33-4]|nr:hypothetical protein [Paraburkholderia sp. HD33-4]